MNVKTKSGLMRVMMASLIGRLRYMTKQLEYVMTHPDLNQAQIDAILKDIRDAHHLCDSTVERVEI